MKKLYMCAFTIAALSSPSLFSMNRNDYRVFKTSGLKAHLNAKQLPVAGRHNSPINCHWCGSLDTFWVRSWMLNGALLGRYFCRKCDSMVGMKVTYC